MFESRCPGLIHFILWDETDCNLTSCQPASIQDMMRSSNGFMQTTHEIKLTNDKSIILEMKYLETHSCDITGDKLKGHITIDMLQPTAHGTAIAARLLQFCGHFKGFDLLSSTSKLGIAHTVANQVCWPHRMEGSSNHALCHKGTCDRQG